MSHNYKIGQLICYDNIIVTNNRDTNEVSRRTEYIFARIERFMKDSNNEETSFMVSIEKAPDEWDYQNRRIYFKDSGINTKYNIALLGFGDLEDYPEYFL